PGRSFAGKTTLTHALLKAGATYYSDEYAVIDDEGLIHPYPRRLSVRVAGEQYPQRVKPEEVGDKVGTAPLRPAVAAVARYQPGAHWTPRRLAAGQAALELLNNAIPAQTRPVPVMDVLERVAPQVVALKGLRGEADETAEALLRLAEAA